MSPWASVVQAVLAFLAALLGLKAEQAGKDAQRAADQGQVLDDVRAAQDVRADVQRELAADPGSVLAPDEFTRRDET